MNPKAAILLILTLIATPAALPAQSQPPASTRLIVVSLQDRRLALVEDGSVTRIYRVAVGRRSSPSPAGTFVIENRVTDPTWYHAGQVIPPGPSNPVGTRWMGLSIRGYGIHGTNVPRSIGRATSHGCIRMARRDLEDLFSQVRVGDTVEILGQRDPETVALFGGPVTPAPLPLLTARTSQPAATPASTGPAASAAGTGVVLAATLPIGR